MTVQNGICYVQAADCRIRVRRITPPVPKRPALVFLHEGLGNIEIWRDFPDVLCRETGCTGVIYDRRGYGGSDMFPDTWSADYQTLEATRYLPAVLDACGIDRALLIGHSDGGTIALIAAATCPERVTGVITEAAHIFNEPVTRAGIREAVTAYETGRLKKRLSRYHGDHTEMIFRRWADRWLSPEFRTWNIDPLLPHVTCPVLAIQGAEDEYGSPAQAEGIVRQVSGPAEIQLVPGCQHIPHLQAQQTVLARMKRFIRNIRSVAFAEQRDLLL
ncbi:alpha/beta hydrolase [Desulfonema ishimotonii]|uniref:Alpha/beta hydrolase n=1 Tax=Desulfonema ishimotonii TaxID=45657 RepID=A0A401FXP4_9BACT|nr:alpha/beta hydrolase [Desulfonema ishimotonii]GBC61703.1 alpha/beta hydrolase [Desulfonema ishimotonii]